MTEDSKKSFASIRDDYAFFEAHTTEFDQDLYHYQQNLAQFFIPAKPLKFLDFGCGTGVFTSRFLKLLHLSIQELEITLIEPDETYRQNAVNILSDQTQFSVVNHSHLPTAITTQFHLILSNHVLYYVPDLRRTIRQLIQFLHPQGILLIAMAGKDNFISQFWQKCFDWLEQPIPYHLAEDLIGVLDGYYSTYQRTKINYELCFPDTEINRWKLLRFMLGTHLEQLSQPEVLALFNPYASQREIRITTYHEQFILPAPGIVP